MARLCIKYEFVTPSACSASLACRVQQPLCHMGKQDRQSCPQQPSLFSSDHTAEALQGQGLDHRAKTDCVRERRKFGFWMARQRFVTGSPVRID